MSPINNIAIYWCGPDGGANVEFLPETELLKSLDRIKELKKNGMLHVVHSFESSDAVGAKVFGAVEGGKLPDGTDYTWMKRRRE